jgi:hypothetical protein
MNTIHKDFTTLSDKHEELHAKKYDLSSFGFTQNVTPELTENEQRFADSYRRIGLSFLTEEQVEFLCFKHDLFWSGVENFTGIVPQENAGDIIKFMNETVGQNKIVLIEDDTTTSIEDKKSPERYWRSKDGVYHLIATMEDTHVQNIINKVGGKFLKGDTARSFESVHAEAALRGLIPGSIYLDDYLEQEVDEPKRSLLVAGTRELFKQDLSHARGSRKLTYSAWLNQEAERQSLRRDDPIVLAKVREGYLVVTYWDLDL